jgi:hypothetical protein
MRRNRAEVLAEAPVVDGDVLGVGPPATPVVAETPGVLGSRPPVAVAFDLDEPWGSEAPLGEPADWLAHSSPPEVDPIGDRLGGASSPARG